MKLALASLLAVAGAAAAQEPPPPAPAAFVFEEIAELAPAVIMGETPTGRRQAIPITGGTFSGPGIKGRILPGGADYQLVRSDGSVQVDAGYFIQTDDGVVIHVHNVGVIVPAPGGGLGYAWAAPSFDAPTGKYDWLNKAIFVSRIGPAGDKDHPAVRITIWKVG